MTFVLWRRLYLLTHFAHFSQSAIPTHPLANPTHLFSVWTCGFCVVLFCFSFHVYNITWYSSLWLISLRIIESSSVLLHMVRFHFLWMNYFLGCVCMCVCVWFSRWLSGKEAICHHRRHRRHGFNPWVRKIPWSRKWQPTPVFLPGKFHGQRSLVDCSPWGHKESDVAEHTRACTDTHTYRERERE